MVLYGRPVPRRAKDGKIRFIYSHDSTNGDSGNVRAYALDNSDGG
jgi:hypothetical protein